MTVKKLIRLPEVLAITQLSRSSIYRLIEAGDFPKSISLGVNSIAFVESEVIAWIDSRIAKRDEVA